MGLQRTGRAAARQDRGTGWAWGVWYAERMDERAAWEQEMRRVYLAVTDAPCPACGYNLRGSAGDKCPECAAAIELAVREEAPAKRWDLVAVIGIVLTTLYFAIHGAWQLVWVLDQNFGGTGIVGFRGAFIVGAITSLLTAGLGAAWCIGAGVVRRKRARPAWAIPTNAAAGLLLAVFVVFLLSYGLRYIM